jgi:hypothetical protein
VTATFAASFDHLVTTRRRRRPRQHVTGQVIDLEPDEVPSMTGRSPSWSIQQPRWVSHGCSRSQLVAVAVP